MDTKKPTIGVGAAHVRASPVTHKAEQPTQRGKFGLLERSIKNMQVAAQGMKLMAKEGHTVTSGATAFVQGVSNIASLSPVSIVVGGVQVFSAYLTIKDAWTRVFGRIDNLDQVLASAKASMDAIHFYGELNKEEAVTIQKRVTDLEKEYEKLTARLETVKTITDKGDQRIKVFKQKATSQIEEALHQIDKAKASFKEAEKMQSKGQVCLRQGKFHFETMLKLAESTEGDIEQRFNQFRDLAEDGPEFCSRGIEYLEQAQAAMNRGFDEINQAKDMQMEALTQLAVLQMESELVTKEIKYQTQIDAAESVIKKNVEQIKECTKNFITNIEEEFEIVETVQEDLDDLRRKVNERWTSGAFLVGLGVAVVAPLGPVGKVAAGYAAASAWTNGETIRENVEKIFKVEFPKQKPQVEGLLTFKFNDKSTGWVNRYIKKHASATCGELKIDLGRGKSFTCQVNFNNKRDAIRTEDLVQLNQVMHKGLKEGSLDPAYCLEIIKQLRTQVVDRGSEHTEGHLITQKCPYIVAAENLAKSMLQSVTT